ncbi:MAG: serine--tRNA ligase [Candidatus Bathyarchaeota archaeon]|nr:MAG: serine--tRNA ligase [Candidatus Bathyarchaeota archaeon]
MLDIKLIREHPEAVKASLEKRGAIEKLEMLDDLIKYDTEWRRLLTEVNELRHKRKVKTVEIAGLKKKGKDVSKKLQEARTILEKIERLDKQVKKTKEKANNILLGLPNILHESVPVGVDQSENVVVKTWREPPKFDFEPKNHLKIALNLGLIDAERAAKVAGHGFYYLKEEMVLLDHAISHYTIDFMRNRGYLAIEPPFMMRKKPYLGVTDLESFRDQLYKIEKEDLYLIATSEHPMAAIFMNEVINKEALPIKLVGVSPCFRKEVGAHGKYTKGLFRMHQFNKVEQFIFCLPEDSWRFHEELQKNAEDLYKSLELHFRVVNVCTGDIGTIAAKKYDIEVWMADGEYRETGSNSNCTDYQARRLNIRFREKPGQAPADFVHTLNNTALATSRTMMAILEQFQQSDGSVIIPKVLRPFMGEIEKLKPRQSF